MIEHDINGPFVRAARSASATPQTEVVHAFRVEYSDGTVEHWNAQPSPFSRKDTQDLHATARRVSSGRKVLAASPVQRSVTIVATDWVDAFAPTP